MISVLSCVDDTSFAKGVAPFFDALGKEPKAESQEEPKLKKSAVISTAACLHVFSSAKIYSRTAFGESFSKC